MTVRPLPRYTQMLRQRIYEYFDRDDNRAALNGRILAALVVVFLGMALVTPVAALVSYLFGDPAATPASIGNQFLYALLQELVRAWLAVMAFTAALNAGVLALSVIYRLSPDDARARVLTAFNFTDPVHLAVEDGRLDPRDKERAANLAGGPLTLSVAGNTAVVTEKLGKQRRVLGTGVHLLENFERILAPVDLRAQVAKRETCAQTKDGIPIRANGEVEFRIKGGNPRLSAGLPFQDVARYAWREWVIAYYRRRGMTQRAQQLEQTLAEEAAKKLAFTSPAPERAPSAYPFNDRMVVRAIYSQTLSRDASGAVQPNTWMQNVAQMVMAYLAEVLGELTLDRITEPEDAPSDRTLRIDETPRSEIQREVSARIQAPASSQGCIPIRFSLGNVQLDPAHVDPELSRQVEEQRHATWSAQWTQRAKLAHSSSAEESSRRRETTRAQLQSQAVRRLLPDLAANAEPAVVQQMLVLLTLEYVEGARRESWATPLFTPAAVASMDRLRHLFD